MKLLSIDIETTGLDYDLGDQIIEIGAVLFDPQPDLAADGKINEAGRKWKMFEALLHPPKIIGSAFALQMNNEILQELAGVKPTHITIFNDPTRMVIALQRWLFENGVTDKNPCTIVGKNYSDFDKRFLEKLGGYENMPVERRVLDVGSLCFNPADGKILNLDAYLERIGCSGMVTHRALDDALAVATLVSRFFA